MRAQVWPAMFAAVLACSYDSAPERAATEITDSAGVKIIESRTAAWQRDGGWKVPTDPSLAIGGGADETDALFVNIAGATKLGAGWIVVADRVNLDIRAFDGAGRHQKTLGGPGDGPGEFRGLKSIRALPGDSFYAYDDRLNRISVYDETAGLAYTLQLPVYFADVQRLPGGMWVGATSEGAQNNALPPSRTRGTFRYRGNVVVLAARGSIVDTIATPPGQEIFIGDTWGRMGVMPAPFGHTFSMAVRGSDLIMATGETLGYDVVAATGQLVSQVRGPQPQSEVTPEEAKAYRAAMLDLMPPGPVRESLENLLDQAAMPESKALVSDVLIAPDGTVWLSAYQNYRYNTGVWHVFSSNGAYLGPVQMPPHFTLLEAGNDYILGTWRDDLGVRSVRQYRISR